MLARLAANAVWRSSTPAGPALGPIGAEAAARGLVVHSNAFLPRRNRNGLDGSGLLFQSLNRRKCNRGAIEGNTVLGAPMSYVCRLVAGFG
jgi:hypothetical protein